MAHPPGVGPDDPEEEDPSELPEWAAALADSESPVVLRWLEARLCVAMVETSGGPTGTIARALLEVRARREAVGGLGDGVDPLLDSDPRAALVELVRLGREAEALLSGEARSPATQEPRSQREAGADEGPAWSSGE